MSAWRRKALALFPELHGELGGGEYTLYSLYFDLLPHTRTAHAKANESFLRRVYGFAEWCLLSENQELWNPAGVAFYEHLFDDEQSWHDVAPWISPEALREAWSLIEFRLGAER